jgi:hypothetical protein
MNKTKTPTANKKTFPLRLPPDIYKKVRDRVQKEKDKGNYGTYTRSCRIILVTNCIVNRFLGKC